MDYFEMMIKANLCLNMKIHFYQHKKMSILYEIMCFS